MSSEPGYAFDFGPAPLGVQIVAYALPSLYFICFLVLSFLWISRRNSRFLRPRFPPTLLLFFLFETFSISLNAASIIGGKAPTCLSLEILYTSANFFTFHFIASPFLLILTARINEEKRHFHSKGHTPLLWKLIPYLNSLLWRLFVAFLFAALQVAAYLVVKFVAPLPGDCNRTAILVLGCFHLFLALIGVATNTKLLKVEDPIFWKMEISIAGLLNLPTIITISMYAFNPVVFPVWFDFRWLNVYNSLVALLAVVAFPVGLTFHKFEMITRKVFRVTDQLNPDDMDVKTNNFLFSLSKKVDELHAILDHPVLRDAFVAFCSKLWCCENVLFLLQVREYKLQFSDTPASRERARKIVEQYLERDAPLEINLVDTTRKKVLANMETNIDLEVFHVAEREISTVVKSDSLKKWYLAPEFKEVLSQIVSSRNSSNLASMEVLDSRQPTERPRSYAAVDDD